MTTQNMFDFQRRGYGQPGGDIQQEAFDARPGQIDVRCGRVCCRGRCGVFSWNVYRQTSAGSESPTPPLVSNLATNHMKNYKTFSVSDEPLNFKEGAPLTLQIIQFNPFSRHATEIVSILQVTNSPTDVNGINPRIRQSKGWRKGPSLGRPFSLWCTYVPAPWHGEFL